MHSARLPQRSTRAHSRTPQPHYVQTLIASSESRLIPQQLNSYPNWTIFSRQKNEIQPLIPLAKRLEHAKVALLRISPFSPLLRVRDSFLSRRDGSLIMPVKVGAERESACFYSSCMPRLTRSPTVVLPLAIAGVAHATRRLRLLSYGLTPGPHSPRYCRRPSV